MVSVPLCTKLEMSDINKGNQGFPYTPPLPLSTTRLLGTRSKALLPIGSQRCEWRKEVGDPTQCLRILLP